MNCRENDSIWKAAHGSELTLYRIMLNVLTNVPLLSLTDTAAEDLWRVHNILFSAVFKKKKQQRERKVQFILHERAF